MRNPFPFFILLVALAGPSMAANTPTKTDSDLQREYLQVRKIALKDSRVQAAFENANERLDQRILEIDPSLRPLVDKESMHPKEPGKPQAPRTAHHESPAIPQKSVAHEHVVIQGETLSSIAGRHHVSVTALKAANHITDERKLRVGQKLVIPVISSTAKAEQAKPAKPAKPIQEASSDGNSGWWSELKKNL